MADWDSGEGARRVGGRWSSPGRRVIYAALDPSTAILEVAVHKGFSTLDVDLHYLLEIGIDPATVHVADLSAIPNANWLTPGSVSAGQQTFGDALLAQHPIVVLPSVVSTKSWNVVIDVDRAQGLFRLINQEPFSLDPRLHPPRPASQAMHG